MTFFLLAAAFLVVLSVAFLLFPLLRRPSSPPSAEAGEAGNLAILREQLAELERERAAGKLDEADFVQAKTELQYRLLEENRPGAAEKAADGRSSPLLAAMCVLFLVACAFSGYILLGNPAALEPELFPQAAAQPSAEQFAEMTARLETHLRENPEDEQGWLMLARSYKALDRIQDAVAIYEKIEERLPDDAGVLADYAEALSLAALPAQKTGGGTVFKGKPRQLLSRALELDPNHGKALFFAGAAAMEAGEREKAAEYWQRLLPQVEEGSELHALLTENIARFQAEREENRKAAGKAKQKEGREKDKGKP
ncbi:MAG: c-type cytochrome biogenesis protein CcmI [Zoogloeaceae bacterium]|jgi:cytochrome c-type biogenesis protein CcmH|nr:c-type cytochrome biogenesis protein CcmI [Zoogloeaceae bacterium]